MIPDNPYKHCTSTVSPSTMFAYRRLSFQSASRFFSSFASLLVGQCSVPLKYKSFGRSPRVSVSNAARSTSVADFAGVRRKPLGQRATKIRYMIGNMTFIIIILTKNAFRRHMSVGMAPGSTLNIISASGLIYSPLAT
jgi:hypothetical protein